MNKNELLLTAIRAALEAGDEIVKVYESEFAVEHKDDKSPLTLADKNGHLKIMEHLEGTGIPVLSEEGREMGYEERKDWDTLWIVDPLDGTKEFVKRNGEFTVNIALVHNGNPVAGVIWVPVKEWLYFSSAELGAYKVSTPTSRESALEEFIAAGEKLPADTGRTTFTAVASRSHMSSETEELINTYKEKHGEVEIVSMGSSLKICLVAEGAADIYPRFAPTMEWDTAAGQAIVQGAGKQVIDHNTGEPMRYNRQELLNNWFIVK